MNDLKRIRIAFVTPFDALDKRSMSGIPYFLSRLLNQYCGDVELIHNFWPKITKVYLLKNLLSKFTWLFIKEISKERFLNLLGKKYDWRTTAPSISKYYARIIKEKIKDKAFDIIFSERGSFCLAYLDTKIPIIYESDATFKVMENYYPSFSKLAQATSRNGNMLEKMALERATLCLFPSFWAANSAIRDYGIEKDKIKIIPYPAHLDVIPIKDIVLKSKQRDVLTLLFVGKEWDRKGGDIAVDVLNELNKFGIHTHLYVCGCIPPKKYFNNKNMQMFGFLNKNKAADREKINKLFLKAHFFILPTKAEAFGIVFAEASAYGLPVIATDTGGVSSIVFNNTNGLLLSLDASGKDFALAIKNIWQDPIRYDSMRIKARLLFEERLSGEVWGRSVDNIVKEALTKSS